MPYSHDDQPAFEKIRHSQKNKPNAKPRNKKPWRQHSTNRREFFAAV